MNDAQKNKLILIVVQPQSDLRQIRHALFSKGVDFVVYCCERDGLTDLLGEVKQNNVVIFDADTSDAKAAIKSVYGLPSVINASAKAKADNYFSNSSCGIQYNFDDYTLPQGFATLKNCQDYKSFYGQTETGFVACLQNRKTDIESFFKVAVECGIVKEPQKSFCFKIFGLSAAAAKEKIQRFATKESKAYVCDDGYGDIALFVLFDGASDVAVDNVLKSVYSLFADNLYADFDATLQEVFVHLAKLGAFKATCAESLTGGMIASMIVDVPDASKVFDCSFVTYSNDAKHTFIDVSQQNLEKYGAVSSQVAQEMSQGALKKSQADIAVAVTGIAGPSGATLKKPVGLVYIAVSTAAHTEVIRRVFNGDRTSVRKQTANTALFLLIKNIKKI